MNEPSERPALPVSENTGKCYIDPESTRIFIEALLKSRAVNVSDETLTAGPQDNPEQGQTIGSG